MQHQQVSKTVAVGIPPDQHASSLKVEFWSKMRRQGRKRPYTPNFKVEISHPRRFLLAGEESSLTVIFCPFRGRRGQYRDTMLLTFKDSESGKEVKIRRRLTAVVTTGEDFHLLRPTSDYTPRMIRPRVDPKDIVPGPTGPALSEVKWVHPLQLALVPRKLKAVLSQQRNNDVEMRNILINLGLIPSGPLTEDNHTRLFRALLHVEEESLSLDLQLYDMTGVVLKAHGDFYMLRVAGLSEGRPSVIVGDSIRARASGTKDRWFQGRVFAVLLDEVKVKFHGSFDEAIAANADVQFELNRLPLRRMHQAIDVQLPSTRILFPAEAHIQGTGDPGSLPQPCNRKIAGNEQQLHAVARITNMPPGSPPFVVFGPPGTGKTMTVVEAIRQLTLKAPSVRVLACAPSNSAADILAERLAAEGMSPSELFRLNAPSRSREQLPKGLATYSRLSADNVFTVPPVNVLSTFKVVVSTCLSASVPYGIDMPRGHFSHIFVDEGGQAMEPEALIAIRTLGDAYTNLIVAGDPKQLGPICRSRIAEEIEPEDSGRHLGLGWSYLDRLMERDMYDDGYRGVTWVKLLKNWRSHPSILEYPNEAFYQGELEAHADPAVVNSLLRFESLPNKQFPIIFHGIAGKDEREAESPSYFNRDEASLVKKYVMELFDDKRFRLKDEHIGIIAPYSAQCGKIRQLLRKQFPARNIKVGSVEEFQGQERRVIILSAVRSKPEGEDEDDRHGIGFVKNPRRFNVAITRAQALLIVIGNPDLLYQDEHWRGFMAFVDRNGGWTGLEPDWDTRERDDTGFADAISEAVEQADRQVPGRARTIGMGAQRGGGRSGARQFNPRSAEQGSGWRNAL
ncbi:P-loop containing nucleoside triphosphate hydrolase protein [Exidia glandulosa HHB12029]|uniref:RNA helicase n=1 Tax=Exidia glandulosa HHB12029 TaxID=1314781 RepID=A0A165C9W8_EXIGL|nr:P-loop containing nucleoside triphosphate hydrolase protein [Exidia glandulosa HHB12029]